MTSTPTSREIELNSPRDSGSVLSINPATEEMLASFPATEVAKIPEILERARAAQKEWSARPLYERCSAVRLLRDVIFDSREEILLAITSETGKPRAEAIFAELILALDTAGFMARMTPRWLRTQQVPHHNLVLKTKVGSLEFEPHGVIAIISPWNFPFAIPMAQIIPAILAGNAVVLKPSELTPAVGALVGKVIQRAGVPLGVVQVVQGGGDVGAALVAAGPDKVIFTGSVATGRQIAEACARKLIPSVLELGGKDAMIVLADADLEIASSGAVWGSFTNCGQACLSVERIYVERSIAEKFTALCVEKTQKLGVGRPSDPDAEIGPMIRPRQIERIEQQLTDAISRGAKILVGGQRLPQLGLNFFAPTVITNVDSSMELMRDETFGPVLAIQTVDSAEEAVALANDSAFGLAASVWTSNSARGRALALQLCVGSVMINDVASYYGITEAPHGGRGVSGWGRTHGHHGLMEMVQPKYIDQDRLPRIPKAWWFGYSEQMATAADRFTDFLFAREWHRRMRGLIDSAGARRLVFRRDRI
jgi:acyl-CoA reductase-like NAD-dependent aldehyde dehydrogenase